MLGSGNTDKRIFVINLAISYVPKSLYNTGNLQNSLKIKVSISVLHVHFADGLTPAVRCYKIFWINGWSGRQDRGDFYLTPNPWHDCYFPFLLSLPFPLSKVLSWSWLRHLSLSQNLKEHPKPPRHPWGLLSRQGNPDQGTPELNETKINWNIKCQAPSSSIFFNNTPLGRLKRE